MRTSLKDTDEKYVVDLFRNLFLGKLDGSKTHEYKSQDDIAQAIQLAMRSKYPDKVYKTSQSQVSKVYTKYFKGKEFIDKDNPGETYLIDKVGGVYKLITSTDVCEKALSELKELCPFVGDDYFCNSSYASTIFAYKIHRDDASKTEDLFRKILQSACFEICIYEYENKDYCLMEVFLNVNSKHYQEAEKRLKGLVDEVC